jgi:nicotinamide riboside kinase
MRIGLVGTVSVGKTTLVKELAKLNEFKDYYTSTERSKYLRDLGIPLNTDSTTLGQQIFTAERASELLKDNLLTDRTCWDVAAFTLSAKSIEWYEKETLVKSLMLQAKYYDLVIYVSPEGVEIEDNGVRTIDSEYRNTIDWCIQELLDEYPPTKLIAVKGSTEERIQEIIKHINKGN